MLRPHREDTMGGDFQESANGTPTRATKPTKAETIREKLFGQAVLPLEKKWSRIRLESKGFILKRGRGRCEWEDRRGEDVNNPISATGKRVTMFPPFNALSQEKGGRDREKQHDKEG